jgi:hypothetical protein
MNKDVLSGKTTFRSVTFSLCIILSSEVVEGGSNPKLEAAGHVRPLRHCCGDVASRPREGRRLTFAIGKREIGRAAG